MLLLPFAVHTDELFDTQMKLAKYGDAEAQFRVGEMYETGIGVRQDMNEAMYWMTRAANQKHETAAFKLLYWDMEKKGLSGKNKDRMQELNYKAKQGNAQAQYFLGKMYAYGVGINQNKDVAFDWLSKAASAGVLEAELEIASLKEGGQREVPRVRSFNPDPCNEKTSRFLSTC